MNTLPIPAGLVIIVTGSLQAKVEDRTHQRSEISPVSIVGDDGVTPIDYFQDKGELGVSSFVFWDDETTYYSTGSDLFHVHLPTGEIQPITVDGLIDVHEMSRIGDRLWLANTGSDEVISVDPADGHRVERTALATIRQPDAPVGESIDRFHTNQVFTGHDGERFALVHHATGRQLLKRIKTRLLKTHGDGGVIDLINRDARDLALTAPHSATKVGDEWWVCDSGRAQLAVFSADWELQANVPTSGWGRGAELTDDGSTLFVGLSPIRSRYRATISSPQVDDAAIEAIGVAGRTAIGLVTVPGIEQVNNVYLVPAKTAAHLEAL